MNKIYLVSVLLLLSGQLIKADKIDSLLCDIHDKDQQVRQELIQVSKNPKDQVLIKKALDKMQTTDSLNQNFIADLLDTKSWPNNLSDKANAAIFLVIDHAKLGYQKKYFSQVQKKVEEGVLDKGSYYTLEDRMLMYEYKKQRYGTQTVSVKDSKGKIVSYVWPVENTEEIEQLRQEAGLPPMKQYLEMLKQTFGKDVVWDKKLTPEILQNKFGLKWKN